MFLQGICITLITGLLWCCIGIVYSRVVQKEHGFYLFLFLSGLIFSLTSWSGTTPRPAGLRAVLAVAAVMIPAAAAGQAGFLSLRSAMRRGSHGTSWSIAQSAMLCPFVAGMIFFGECVTWIRIAGMMLLLSSLILLGRSQCGSGAPDAQKGGAVSAFLAFGLLGLQQTLTLLPNRLPGVTEAALSWRIPLYSLFGLSWIVAVLRFREYRSAAGILMPALLNGALTAAGQWCFFRALDLLAPCGAAGIAYPLAVGSSIALFSLYTEWIRGERTGFVGKFGVLLAVLGMMFLAF